MGTRPGTANPLRGRAPALPADAPGTRGQRSLLHASLAGAKTFRYPGCAIRIPRVALRSTFKVSAGQVVLLGSYSADRELRVGSNSFSLASRRISGAALGEQSKTRYAGFAGAPVGCLACDP